MAHRPRTPSSDELPRLPSATSLHEAEVGDKHTLSSSPPIPHTKRYRRESTSSERASDKRSAITNMALTCLNLLTAEESKWASVKLAFLQTLASLTEESQEEHESEQLLLTGIEPVDTTMTDVLRGLEASMHNNSTSPPPPEVHDVPERSGMRAPPIKPNTAGKTKKAAPTATTTSSKPASSGKAAAKPTPAAAPARSNKTALPASPYKAALCSNLPPSTANQPKLDGFTTVLRPSKRANKTTPGPCELILSSEGKKGKVTVTDRQRVCKQGRGTDRQSRTEGYVLRRIA